MTIWQTDKYFVKLFYFRLNVVLSIEKAKIILWEDAEGMTDNQVQDLLDFLYCICGFVYDKNSLNKPKINAK